MRLFEIHSDFNSFDVETAWTLIKQHCQPFLTQNPNWYDDRLYHGTKHTFTNFTKLKVNPNRKPRHNPKDMVKFVNDALTDAGFTANRNNSVFCSSERLMVDYYGEPCLVFPIGNFSFTWSSILGDFVLNSKISDPESVADSQKFIETLERASNKTEVIKKYYKNETNSTLLEAISSGSEIMISCKEVCLLKADLATSLNHWSKKY